MLASSSKGGVELLAERPGLAEQREQFVRFLRRFALDERHVFTYYTHVVNRVHSRRVALLFTLAAISTSAIASPARAVLLVDRNGAPIGGQWQSWANEAKVPTWPGRVELAVTGCPESGAIGCTWLSSPPIVHVVPGLQPALSRSTLYHELGHVFAARYIGARQQAAFEHAWGLSAPWSSQLPYGGTPEEWFAEGYQLCALHESWTYAAAAREGYSFYYPAEWAAAASDTGWRPPALARSAAVALAAQRRTCALVRTAASAARAQGR